MLNAFQKKLSALTLDPDDKFESHVRQRFGKNPPKNFSEELKGFVLLLPKILRRIFVLYAKLQPTSQVKEVGSHFLAYMYQPEDFLPENERNGLFGYLDDVYLAALFYELMLEEIESSKQFRISSEDAILLKKVTGLRSKAVAVIPEEAIKIRQMIGELFEGDKTTFISLFGGRSLS